MQQWVTRVRTRAFLHPHGRTRLLAVGDRPAVQEVCCSSVVTHQINYVINLVREHSTCILYYFTHISIYIIIIYVGWDCLRLARGTLGR